MVRRVVLVAFIIVLMAPVWFMFTGSLQDIQGVLAMPPHLLPIHPTLANYAWLFRFGMVGRWALNSCIVVAIVVLASVAVSCMAGYAFAFYRFRFKKVLWLLLLAGIMVPRISLIIPLFVTVRKIGISGTLLAAAAPTIFTPVGMYLARTYFEGMPASLLESARMDGATEWQVLWRVVAPVCKPIIATLGLLAAMGALGDYLWQMLQLHREELQTLLVGITRSTMKRGGEEMQVNPLGRAMAGGTLLLLPMLIVFGVANKYFVTALGGAVKE